MSRFRYYLKKKTYISITYNKIVKKSINNK